MERIAGGTRRTDATSGNGAGTRPEDLLELWRRFPLRARRTLLAGAVALAEGRVADFDRILTEARGRRSDSEDDPSDD